MTEFDQEAQHHPVVFAHENGRRADPQLRIADSSASDTMEP